MVEPIQNIVVSMGKQQMSSGKHDQTKSRVAQLARVVYFKLVGNAYVCNGAEFTLLLQSC